VATVLLTGEAFSVMAPNCMYMTAYLAVHIKNWQKKRKIIRERYPRINVSSIIFEKVQEQPDSISYGIYGAAFATSVILGRNPCEDKYSNDFERMRRHFMNIIETNKLSPFPSQ